ncbi:hypothetical protein [Streptomyces lydicus]|uniref:hypothetical protein n=1 Tax=Streptomyces lydicus TaxID=47763 RepID=UPI0010117A6F|nr:hypothetical protein [Streptomyces lydicus]MDC7337197.1 hypothetical protein [Streptomyces lydicus]UEG93425.1 hypothetical protein LJ741_24540 [Streptomyces lydicus]
MTEDNPDIGEISQAISEISENPVTGEVRIKLRDGRMLEFSLGVGDRSSVLRQVSYSFTSGVISLESLRGDLFEVDPEEVESGSIQPPVVYLDQGHWSALSNSIFDRARVRDEKDLEAAEQLIEWAESGRVILPVSSAHALETSALFDERRQNLASTILRLSRGWQMRSPVAVRMHEMSVVLSEAYAVSASPSELDIFSLAAGAMDTKRRAVNASDLPPGLLKLTNRLTAFSTIYDVLMNPERVPSVVAGWHEHFNNVSGDPEFRARSPKQKAIDGRAMALSDVLQEAITAALGLGIPVEERLASVLFAGLDSMPSLRVYGDAIGYRLKNRAKWEPNDLIDILFLGCAAAYADVVVAERVATNYLQGSWRSGDRPCPVVAKLPEAVEKLSHLLD